MSDFETLQDSLDIAPVKSPSELEKEKQKAEEKEKQAEGDYDYATREIKELMEIAKDVVSNAADVANETGEARQIEAFSQLLKVTGDMAEKILTASKTKSEIEKNRLTTKTNSGIAGSITNNTNNTVFVGSSKDLLKQLKLEEKEIIDVESEEIEDTDE